MLKTEIGSVNQVGIRPNSSILSVLSHLNYKAWYAVAEFVDNSIQSYLTNKEALEMLHGQDFKLEVKVWLEQNNNLIEIRDNAAGISAADFPRAFKPAEVPLDRTGLSEFGMGMKTAACWFTPTWNVRTKALGEPVERTVRFDLANIVGNKLEHLPVLETPAPINDHYTVVRLENVGKKFPVKRTQKKLRDHLASIYRVHLRSGTIQLFYDEDKEPLRYQDPEILRAPPYNSVSSEPVLWRKEIDFSFGEGKRVMGFAALRQEGSTTHAGFALFRRNRLILGSDDETYRPQEIFGNSNSYRYQRLFGELHVEGFEVSHTKDGFHWDDFEEDFLERLRVLLKSDALDLLAQADNYRARPTRTQIQSQVKEATESLVSDLAETAEPALSMQSIGAAVIAATQPLVLDDTLTAVTRYFELNIDDHLWCITLDTTVDAAVSDWVSFVAKDAQQRLLSGSASDVHIVVSMAHPFSLRFLGPKGENAEVFIRFAVVLALSCLKFKRAGYSYGALLAGVNGLLRATAQKDFA